MMTAAAMEPFGRPFGGALFTVTTRVSVTGTAAAVEFAAAVAL